MSNEDETFEEINDYTPPIKKERNGDALKRKILSYGLVFIIAFSTGCGLVGISMMVKENSARNDLAKTNFLLRDIIGEFSVNVYNTTSEGFTIYDYQYNSNASTFENAGGLVLYNDEKEDIEFMTIYFDTWAAVNRIQSIAFKVNEKSQLNIIIFADGKEQYNALKITNDFSLTFIILAEKIVVYVF